MNKRHIQLVKQTFEMILPIADTIAFLFYERFFTLEPGARPLFPADMAAQRAKFLETMVILVRGLDQPEALVGFVRDLGLHHEEHGVQPIHYAAMNRAIVETLADCLGPRFTPEMRAAWENALVVMAAVMQGQPLPASRERIPERIPVGEMV